MHHIWKKINDIKVNAVNEIENQILLQWMGIFCTKLLKENSNPSDIIAINHEI